MTYVYITTYLIGMHGKVRESLEIKKFQFRFQARSWLLLNGYLLDEDNEYRHFLNHNTAAIESRRPRVS